MTHDRDEVVRGLQQRVEALEAGLAKIHKVQRQSPQHASERRKLRGLIYLVTPLLAFAGWAMAQQGPEPFSTLIRNIGGITQVTAPFEVVDASGKVILSVDASYKSGAATSIWNNEGFGGNLTVSSSGGTALATVGVNKGGHGTLFAADAGGKPQAFVQGLGGIYVQNESGTQVAGLVVTKEQKGMVAVRGKGNQAIVEMTESAAGGVLVARNSNNEPVVNVGADENGKGSVSIVDKTRAVAELTVNGVGAGDLILANAEGKFGLEAVGAPQRVSAGGGAIVVFNGGGEQVAGFGTTPEGRGNIAIMEKSRVAVQITTNDTGAGELTLRNAEGGIGMTASGANASDPTTGGGVTIFDKVADPVAALGLSASGKGILKIFDQDHAVAELSANESGAGALVLSNAQGDLGLQADGALSKSVGGGVVAFNKAGDPVAALGSSADGKGEITVAENNKGVAALTANAAGAGYLFLNNTQGEIGVSATGAASDDSGGGAGVVAFNNAGDPVAALGSSIDGKGKITVAETNKSVAELTVDEEGAGSMVLYRSTGTRAVVAGGNSGVLGSYNDQEQVIAALGATLDENKGRIAIYGQKGVLVELTEGATGAGLIQVKNPQDTVVAGITAKGNGGAVLVTNSSGVTVAEMSATNADEGQFAIWHPGSQVASALLTRSIDSNGGLLQIASDNLAVASVTVSSLGAGFMQLTDPSGRVTVEAGTDPGGIGVVQVGPNIKCAPGGMGLTIPDCIKGRP